MDVPAHHPVNAAFARGMGDRFLEIADELDDVLHAVLQIGRQRPVGQLEQAAAAVQPDVGFQQQRIGLIAREGEPAGIEHHPVERIAVHDHQSAAVGGGVDDLVRDLDPAEMHAGIAAQHLVMVARDQDDARAPVRHLQDAAHHLVMRVGPVPALFQPPAVDDIADQIERLALHPRQEIDQQFGVAARRAEMDVGNIEGAIFALWPKAARFGQVQPFGQRAR